MPKREVKMRKEYESSTAKRGSIIPPEPGKTRITIRIDNEILDWFRAQVHRRGGGSYQTLINDALKDHLRGKQLESLLRRVIREEIKPAAA
jgi:uncharacterized protein (DUF4415 family)